MSSHYPVEVVIQTTSGAMLVGAFNVKSFGKTKVGKEDVLNILVQVVAHSSSRLYVQRRYFKCLTSNSLLSTWFLYLSGT